jgi:hypothetical protein
MLMDLLKPALIVGALGYGLYAGFDLLHRPVEPPIPQRVHWSSGEVRIDAPALVADREGAASSDQVESGGTRTQVPDAKPSSGTPATGRLAQSLSELLGVEISIQANEQALQDELVLFEGGTDDKRWRVVLSEPEAAQQPQEPLVFTEGDLKRAVRLPTPEPETGSGFLLTALELEPASWRSALLPALLIVLAIGAWLSSRREAEGITEDSSDFREALATWLPWLMARQATPRAVKRFVNKLRYIAIRLRAGAGNTAGFPEPNTVALAAIGFLDEDWLMDDGDYERVVQNRLDELLRPGAGPAANLGQQATVEVTKQL